MLGDLPQEWQTAPIGRHPLGVGEAGDLASLVAFLASEEGRWITNEKSGSTAASLAGRFKEDTQRRPRALTGASLGSGKLRRRWLRSDRHYDLVDEIAMRAAVILR